MMAFLKNSPVRTALDLMLSIPFLARYERENRNLVWRFVCERNFPDYVELVADNAPWKSVTLWLAWAQEKMMRLIIINYNRQDNNALTYVDEETFSLFGKHMHVRTFAFLHGFPRGRLLAARRPRTPPPLNIPEDAPFADKMEAVSRRARFLMCSAQEYVPHNITHAQREAWYAITGAATDNGIAHLGGGPLADPPRRPDGTLLLELQCVGCGTGESDRWFQCTGCAERVCGECGDEHIKQAH
jgi:hypothetical protein